MVRNDTTQSFDVVRKKNTVEDSEWDCYYNRLGCYKGTAGCRRVVDTTKLRRRLQKMELSSVKGARL